MEPLLHQPPLASHHCFYIYFLYLSEKGNYIFCLLVCLLFFLVFICFHSGVSLVLSVPMQVFTVTLLTPLPRDSTAPAWAPAHLATSVSILALAGCIYSPRTWRASQGHMCLPA